MVTLSNLLVLYRNPQIKTPNPRFLSSHTKAQPLSSSSSTQLAETSSTLQEMRMIEFALRSARVSGLSLKNRQQWMVTRTIFTNPISANDNAIANNNKSGESAEDFEKRIFGGVSDNSQNNDSFFQKLDRLGKSRGRSSGGGDLQFLDGLDESFNTLSDGMDGKLKKAATYFEFDHEEICSDNYTFRPDVQFRPGTTYEPKDLDLKKPGIRRNYQRIEFETTTEEVLRKADFRNVRFLANFLTEAGIIFKRSMTRISAKAQRKVAREIKTARAFGLMPFTTMGQDKFLFGTTREELDDDDEYENQYYRAPRTRRSF